jgi:hypothetical protein
MRSMNTAIFSECGKYRYLLTRSLTKDSSLAPCPIVFIMLNPSKATSDKDDPTIRRCIKLARDNGYTDLIVLNLFAYIAADPEGLAASHSPVGPENYQTITKFISNPNYPDIVIAWGANRLATELATILVRSLAPRHGKDLLCLGKTKSGAPRHPLYIKKNQKFEVYE